ncbi:dienelactone hydrolase family protein [Haloplanus salinarum]|uniref:dienelactone hydrolase family protein n=1 Tax=Haloplanus salinarum TaxID=1912324 RepID=UPI00214C3FB3|nr:dienelactone hydrolase family protein [Haloplanus salinarum]
MSTPRTAPILVAALVLLSGCSGVLPGDGTPTETSTPTDRPSSTPTAAPTETEAEATYTQTPHTGCQPGAIEKNGTCQAVTSGGNADIFDAENLSAITSERTTVDGTPGYLARPADDGEYPAVVMIHEWWGLNENIEHMADILAGHGYVVFAVDLYDGEVAANSSEAARLSGQVRENPDVAVSKMSRAVSGLRERSDTTDRVASLGWCFGGGQSLQLSLSDADLNATVIYYGTLATNESTLQRVDGPVLGVFGSEDQVVGIENVREFDRTLGEVGVEREIYVYEGAGHAFANPSGESFHPNDTRDAWGKTLTFLDENLRTNESAT